ncbi:MAG: T9SS type A sorting domain-containing protein [bacterium]
MKKVFAILMLLGICLISFRIYAEGDTLQPTCLFNMYTKASIGCEIHVYYAGNAPSSATYLWNFDGATIISGSGQGPYTVVWDSVGWKTVTLSINYNGQTCTNSKQVHVVDMPALFNMTGGGSYPYGGPGVHVGLSGSEPNYTYYLLLNGNSTNTYAIGNGNVIDFGLITAPGTYTCKAKVDSCYCTRMMDGTAVVTVTGGPPGIQYICMVSYDTTYQRNKIIWNKMTGYHLAYFNIYRESAHNNAYVKIGEVPYNSFSTFLDTTANPLVKSDKYVMTVTDSSGNESTKCPYHKTVHLNINPGIYGFNLIWNLYEGFDYYTCNIYRKLGTGAWQLLDSVASNVTSYTDFYVTSGLATYYIQVIRYAPCNPSLKGGVYESTLSNLATSAPLGLPESGSPEILIYPNPVREKVSITFPSPVKTGSNLELYSIEGRKLFEQLLTTQKTELDLSAYQRGLYILRITGDNTMIVRKIYKE